MSRGGFTLVDFTIPTRDHTMTHEPTEAPLCDECKAKDLCFFDPTCSGCQDLLLDSDTTIPQLFAVMRQWVPQTQRNMSSLAREVLRRGANVNDRDAVTDLSLLHYACKSGAAGVGNVTAAVNLVTSLLNKGADSELRCRWTNMNALHYAVFFDVPEIVETLVEHKPLLINSTCEEYNGGTSLHIAAANLSLGAVQVLLSHGADAMITDRSGRSPCDCLPPSQGEEVEEVVREMEELLRRAMEAEEEKRSSVEEGEMDITPAGGEMERGKAPTGKPPPSPLPPSQRHTILKSPSPTPNSALTRTHSPRIREPIRTRVTRSPVSTVSTLSSGSSRTNSPAAEEVTMATLGLKIGDRILIDAKSTKPKNGTMRFGGTTEFAAGQWAGIELDEPIGKNDGSCMGIRYFTCKPKYGLFVPMHRISKATTLLGVPDRRKKSVNGKRESLPLTPKSFDAHGQMQVNTDLQLGERVIMSGSRTGTLRYVGTVKFAPGIWMGVELDHAHGKNDGSRSGVRYFKCRPNHGVFVLPSKVKRAPSSSSLQVTSSHSSASASASGSDSTDHPSTSSSPSPHSSPPITKRRLAASSSSKAGPRTKQPRTTTTTSHSALSSPHALSLSSMPDITLEIGMNVFVNGEFGVVRYIGATSFAEGVWLGIELRRPNGKNDGAVQGKKYFSCKPSHGLFVKPEKATHRGINCAKLLPENFQEKNTS